MAGPGTWIKQHKIITVIIFLIILGGIGAALGNNSPTVNTSSVNTTSAKSTTSTVANTNTASKPPAKTSSTTAHVGSTVDIGGSKGLAVTLQQVIDPASGADQYTTPDAGKRFVAVKLVIQNNGSGAYQDDANTNLVLIGSDNQSYTADYNNVSQCTNFNDGQYTLAAGESATGCVVFQVPNEITTSKVQFQTTGSLNDSTGEWLVP